MKYLTWLKRLVLPYEFPDHPLHYDKAAADSAAAEAAAQQAREEAEVMQGLRGVMGDDFVDRMENF